MFVQGKRFRSIWLAEDGETVEIIDQTRLPHEFVIAELKTLSDAKTAIADMLVRGAPLIGATAAYGVCLGLREQCSMENLSKIGKELVACRPTAVNLQWAVERMTAMLVQSPQQQWLELAYKEAAAICDEDCLVNESIGEHGARIIKHIWQQKQSTVHVLTHCNAGWLATVDWGTALSPIFKAVEQGIPLHVWVDETRPRNQGAHLTAWELQEAGIDYDLIVDNAGGHLMQHGMVDLCLVGTDRTAASGDVCNKIGTYLKALAAKDNGVPFYVCLPSSTIDWKVEDGVRDIPIESRSADEVLLVQGKNDQGEVVMVRIAQENTPASNPAFDVTPRHLVSGLITERGVAEASREGLLELFPEKEQGS